MSASDLKKDVFTIGLVSLGHGTSHFFHLILPPLFPWIKAEFALTNAEVGMLLTIFFLISGVGQTLAGFIVDKFGALPALVIGLALSGLASLGFAISQNYLSLIFFAGIAGLGNCVFHPADYTLLNNRVSVKRLGHAFSAHGISGALGWALAPVFLVGLTHLFDWRTAVAASSCVAFVVLVILYSSKALLGGTRGAVKTDAGRPKKMGNFAFLRLKSVWLCFLFFMISALAFGGIQSFAPTAISEIYTIPYSIAILGITTYMLANAGGLIAGGFAASMTNHHGRVIGASLMIAGMTSIFTAFGLLGSWSVFPLLAIIGFGAGVAGPSRDLLVRAASPQGATGRVYGVVYSGLDIGIALAPLIFGLLMDLHLSIWIFVLIGCFQIGAILAATGVNSAKTETAST